MNVADFAFATELFVLIFSLFCWLTFSPQPQQARINPTRSTRYFDVLEDNNNASPEMPVSQSECMPLLPDPWTQEIEMIERSIPVSSNYYNAPPLPQLCLPPAKNDVVEAVINLVEEHFTVKKAQKVLALFAEKTQTAKPKSGTRKAELIQRIEEYLRDYNYQFTMQEIVCNAIRGKLS